MGVIRFGLEEDRSVKVRRIRDWECGGDDGPYEDRIVKVKTGGG